MHNALNLNAAIKMEEAAFNKSDIGFSTVCTLIDSFSKLEVPLSYQTGIISIPI